MTDHDGAVRIAEGVLAGEPDYYEIPFSVVAALRERYDLVPKGRLAALRAVAEAFEQIVSEEEGQTWANPALTPHFVRRLRAALDAAPAAETTSGEARRLARFSDVVGTERAAEFAREDRAALDEARRRRR